MIPALVTLGVVAFAVVGWRGAGRHAADRPVWAALVSGAAVAACLVATSALSGPFSPWDTTRIAPAIALAHGDSPYAGESSGVILSTMYGPIAALAYLPAAASGDPATATILGRGFAFLFCVCPLAACCRVFQASPGRTWRASIFLIATFGLLLCPSLRYSSTFLHADAPALGLSAIACLLAARPSGPGVRAAIACILAVMTKQTMATLPAALFAWVWLSSGPRSAFRWAAIVGVTGLSAMAASWAILDWDAVWLNAVKIPGGVPWKGSAPANLVAFAGEMLLHASPIAIALALVASRPPLDLATDRRSRVFLLAALMLAPMAVLGRVKQAGDVNSFSPCLYPLLLAAASRAVAIRPLESPRARNVLVAVLGALIVAGSSRLGEEVRLLAKERPYDAESAYLKAHDGSVYFPWNPAVHLATSGRTAHHLFSAWERGEAGFVVSERHLRSGLPPRSRYVAFPLKRLGPVAGFGSCLQMLEKYDLLALPAVPIRLAGLPDYECYELTR